MSESLGLAKSPDSSLPRVVQFVFHRAPQHSLCPCTGELQPLIKGGLNQRLSHFPCQFSGRAGSGEAGEPVCSRSPLRSCGARTQHCSLLLTREGEPYLLGESSTAGGDASTAGLAPAPKQHHQSVLLAAGGVGSPGRGIPPGQGAPALSSPPQDPQGSFSAALQGKQSILCYSGA